VAPGVGKEEGLGCGEKFAGRVIGAQRRDAVGAEGGMGGVHHAPDVGVGVDRGGLRPCARGRKRKCRSRRDHSNGCRVPSDECGFAIAPSDE
ncbi:MAG: hypothetical protein IKJ45_12960, partial [Kiritimatiellae bacterium]|nr:hypothetical protein [Kiritimatiellia bacterium]